MKEEKEFYQCNCGNEVLVVDKYAWDETEDFEVSIAIYRHHINTSWSNRLRHIWQIIKYGIPYLDDMYLNKADFNKLKEFINKI